MAKSNKKTSDKLTKSPWQDTDKMSPVGSTKTPNSTSKKATPKSKRK